MEKEERRKLMLESNVPAFEDVSEERAYEKNFDEMPLHPKFREGYAAGLNKALDYLHEMTKTDSYGSYKIDLLSYALRLQGAKKV